MTWLKIVAGWILCFAMILMVQNLKKMMIQGSPELSRIRKYKIFWLRFSQAQIFLGELAKYLATLALFLQVLTISFAFFAFISTYKDIEKMAKIAQIQEEQTAEIKQKYRKVFWEQIRRFRFEEASVLRGCPSGYDDMTCLNPDSPADCSNFNSYCYYNSSLFRARKKSTIIPDLSEHDYYDKYPEA